MKTPQRMCIALVAALGSHFTLSAQTTPVVVEAESATLGADWTSPIPSDAGASDGKYVAIKLGSATVNGSAPGTDARVATYTVTFPAAGTYDLYARVRVGAGGANDDSFFYGTTFGTKGSNTTADWVTANGLSNVGYVAGPTLAVDGGGSGGTGVWKWVDISKFLVNGSAATTFTVAAGALTQTFQIGAREDGLDFDKLVRIIRAVENKNISINYDTVAQASMEGVFLGSREVWVESEVDVESEAVGSQITSSVQQAYLRLPDTQKAVITLRW
ncbi:MAG: hypothetical protein EOO62_30925, partial [Hymenobacter sp.]